MEEQHGSDSRSDGRSDDRSNKHMNDLQNDRKNAVEIRMIAVAVTAIALLGISIPFVWEPTSMRNRRHVATVTPAASHEPRLARRAVVHGNAKQANWDFKFKDLDGKEVELASFKGKVVLLNFWATWCGPCKAEIPGFVELQEKYRDKLTIIGYSVDDTAELAKKYAAQYKMNYPILLGEGREDLQDAYGPIWGNSRVVHHQQGRRGVPQAHGHCT